MARDAELELEGGRFELARERLELGRAERAVAHASCGAVVAFAGTARDHNRGRRVLGLEYEAFDAMTGPEMARIFADCRAELGLARVPGALPEPEQRLRMLVQHRVGSVAIGEPAVVIAVAAPHRARAFEAARFLIDTLKQRLPIWKKELYEGGESWIGERS